MLYTQSLAAPQPRRGVILLVVLALLTLFALVGLSFVYYANAEAEASRHYREALTLNRPDMNPEVLLQYFLEQLVYDVPDNEAGVYSALRGYSLARSMYGYDDAGRNDVPFHGTGRLHYPSVFESQAFQDIPPQARDDYYFINYTYFASVPKDQRFLRDPERLGARLDPTAPRGPFTGGADVPYTYPDLNNLFLAAVKADGTVLMPSFHRPWLFGSNDPAENPNWTNEIGKYLLLRPRPIDMGPGFPYPEDPGGDIKNLICTPGGNDSYWLDLDAPVMTAGDGRLYKPLFAPLILDLENLLNVPQPPGPQPRWQRPLTMAG